MSSRPQTTLLKILTIVVATTMCGPLSAQENPQPLRDPTFNPRTLLPRNPLRASSGRVLNAANTPQFDALRSALHDDVTVDGSAERRPKSSAAKKEEDVPARVTAPSFNVPVRVAQRQGDVVAQPTNSDYDVIPEAHVDAEYLPPESSVQTTSTVPADGRWWEAAIQQRQLRFETAKPLSLSDALTYALQTSPELRALHADTVIQHYEVIRQQAAFDWTTFVDTFWNDNSDPVGDQLAGVQSRLRTGAMTTSGGLRQRNGLGGQFQVSQDLNHNTSNSQFFTPANQGSAKLALEYTQPLLRGSGRAYNEAQIGLAEVDKNIAFEALRQGIEVQLFDVAEAYWQLVLARGRHVQARASWRRAQEIVRVMENRVEVDVNKTQMIRARATTATRLADCVQTEYETVRAQEALERVVFGVDYAKKIQLEVITTTTPNQVCRAMNIDESLRIGLANRPEVQQSLAEIKSASIQHKVAENEIMPQLDLVLNAYSAGLRGGSNIPGAVTDQFTSGEPGYGIGLSFELPIKSRAARAAALQQRATVRKLQDQFETVVADVSLNIRDQTLASLQSTDETARKAEALELARQELTAVETRRRFLVDGDRGAELYLNDLLQTQARLQTAEFGLLQAHVNRGRAHTGLKRATGTLYRDAITPLRR